MGTAIGAVIDYFVAGLGKGVTTPSGVVVPPLSSIDPKVLVFDNWATDRSNSRVVIGHQSYDSGEAGDSESAWYDIGAQRIEESFTIPCFIDVVRDGPAQKPARDAATALYDGVVHLIAADVTLAGILQRGRVGLASHLRFRQTQDSDDTGSGGLRRAYIGFQLVCKNAYIP